MQDFLYYIYKHNKCDDIQYWNVEEQQWTDDYSKIEHISLIVAKSIAGILAYEETTYFVCIGKILPDKEPDPYFLGIHVK